MATVHDSQFKYIYLSFHKMFQVTMEECSSDAFTDTSADKCWESVLKRLHNEIMERRNQGELELPSLELLKSVNGLRMFGFLLPSIIQVM
jgi:histone demethylase JARID1